MFEIFGIEFAGKHSYRDFKITLQSAPKISGPKLNVIKEEIPYMDGVYDFTDLNGTASFGEREITFNFNVIGSNFNDLLLKAAAVKEWLFNGKIGVLKYDAVHDFYYLQARCVSAELSDVNKRHTTATLSVTFSTAPYMTNGGVDIDLITADSTSGSKEYMMFRVSEAVECAYITNGTIAYKPPISAISASGFSGSLMSSITSDKKIHYRIKGTNKLALVQIAYTGDSGAAETISADYVNETSHIYDFYIRNRSGTLKFLFTFTESVTSASDAISSLVGRAVDTVALTGFTDPLLPVSVKTEGQYGCVVRCNDDYSGTFPVSSTTRNAFEIGYGYNRINVEGGNATFKYLTLIEVL